jgi:hypothetical protein
MSTIMFGPSDFLTEEHDYDFDCSESFRGPLAHRDSVPMRFARSMIDFRRWQNAVGYDLELIQEGSAEDRNAIEQMLLRLGVNNWRDVEALATLATSSAADALRAAVKNADLRSAVLYYAPDLVSAS